MWYLLRTGSGPLTIKAAVACLLLAINFSLSAGSQPTCDPDTFVCGDGTCLQKTHLCDGEPDCNDGSDEVDCDYKLCLSPSWFKCKNGKCISHAFYCDESNDCGDWSDEPYNCAYAHVSSNNTCKIGEFKCNEGTCIPFDWVCNGREDCPDKSDEQQNCNVANCDGFHCKSGQCVLKEFRCDGGNDCYDGSDELDCPTKINLLVPKISECKLERGLYACSDGATCIPIEQLCNNKTECLNGDDEGAMCLSNKEMCSGSKCSHTCHISPKGPLCSCPSGYKMQEGSSTLCEDIDECKVYGTCSQRCHNWQGGYGCSCESGYILAEDEKNCIAEKGSEATLVYSTNKEIRAYRLGSQHMWRVQGKQTDVFAVAYDGHYVYWSSQENGQERIMRSRDDGSKKEIIVSSGLEAPNDMAWDWVTRTLYITDSGSKTVSACTEDGHYCSVMVNAISDIPHGIVVVPQEGIMFWTDWGTVPHIAKAGMDGSDPHIFIKDGLQWPSSIALDYGNKRLYWVDAKFHFIESVNLDGSDRRHVLQLPVTDASFIAIFEHRLFWSNYGGKEISSCDKFTGKNRSTIVTERKGTISGIHIYHPALQHPLITNPCDKAQCSHMCFLAPKGKFSCGCPSDMYLDRDNMNCLEGIKTAAIIVGVGNELVKIQHQLLGRLNVTYVTLQNVKKISAITYNSYTNAAIVSDSVSKKIISFDLRKLKSSTLIDSQLGYVVDMEYDHAGRNLYWCDFERRVIEAYSFATGQRVIVVSDLHGDYPISIAFTPAGLMFVGLTASHHNHIDTFSLDGKQHAHPIETLDGAPKALTFQKFLQRVYWVDDATGVIQSTDDEARDRHVWRREQNEPMSMAGLGSFMFWASKDLPYLHWADVQRGGSKMTKLKLNVEKAPKMFLASTEQSEMFSHACQIGNGGCSHVCFALESGAKCGCPLGMRLKSNNLTCVTPSHCSRKEFRCKKDDMCIPKKLRCNGHSDCPSGEDEEGCKDATCDPDSFTCKSGQCILQKQRCNGFVDCSDKSDEEDCVKRCENDLQFTCLSGQCISRTLVCDGIKDCEDGDDEFFCQDASCKSGEFKCNDGVCIPDSWECDGSPDCKDGSDEHSKCEKEKCSDEDFQCSNGQCIDKQFVCDKRNDCGDGSDEIGCKESKSIAGNSTQIECAEDTFRCESASKVLCLPESAKCNGVVECPFGDDESNCGCGDEMFECHSNKKCIPLKWRCDSFDDCPDKSDEANCSKENEIVTSKPKVDCEEFTCNNGDCVLFSKVCNGKPHCTDGSDEGGQCDLACKKGHNPCQHKCSETPKGPRCECNTGYELGKDGRTCLDINECEIDAGLCSHFCRNTDGGFACSCDKGYSLRSDRQTCKAIGRALDIVFVTNEEIRKVSLKTRRPSILTSHAGLTVSGLAVDSRNHQVYWSTAATGKLTRMSQSNEVEKQIERIVEKPKKLALDWITSNVYLVDQLKFPTIKVCSIDDEKCAKLLSATNADEITSIVLDPLQGYIFWSELSVNADNRPKSEIWRSDMDGKNATVIIKSGLAMVSGLALDLVKKQIYWSDQGQGVIEHTNYEGSQRSLLPIKELQRPVGVALFEDDIYWMDGGSGKLSLRSTRFPYSSKQIELHAYDAVHFELVHQALQPEAPNMCSEKDCKEGMCVLTPFGPKCICERSQDCPSIGSTSSAPDSNGGSSAGSVVLALFITIIFMVAIASAWFFVVKQKTLSDLFAFRHLKFENSSFDNAFSDGVRFDAKTLNNQFSNPGYKKQQPSGFEQQPLKSVESLRGISTPVASTKRTIPVDISSCPTDSSEASSPPQMSPATFSPNACLIPIED